MQSRRLLVLLAVVAVLSLTAIPAMAAGTLGDPTLGPNYFQMTRYYDPAITVHDPLWSTTLDLTATGDDPADRAYPAGTALGPAYLTVEHSGNSGPSLAELWLASASGELLVGVLGTSSEAPRREYWALDAGARHDIFSSPATFQVRLAETTLGDDTLQLSMVRVSGDLAAVPEPSGVLLLVCGAGLLGSLLMVHRRAVATRA